MKDKTKTTTNSDIPSHEQESLLKKKSPKSGTHLSKAELIDQIRLLNEQKKELERQNKGLQLAYSDAQSIGNKFKHTKDALNESEDRLRNITENAPNLILEVDRQGHILFMNNFLSGYHLDDVIGRNVCDLSPLNYHDETNKALNLVFTKGIHQSFQSRGLGEDDEMKWYQSNVSPVIVSGEVKSAIIIVSDITDLVRAEERRLSILNTAMDGFWLFNMEGKLLEVNHTYSQMCGYTKQELLSMRVMDLEVVESEIEINARMLKIIEQGEDRFETKHRRKDGSIFDVEVSVQFQPIDGGQFVVFLHDITDRKLIENTLKESEQKFRSYIDFAPLGVFVANQFGDYIEVNSAASKITGFSKKELLSLTLKDLVPEESLEFASAHFSRVVKEGYASGEFAFIRKDGLKRYWSVDAVKLSDHRFIGFVMDITEHKQAEEDLYRSEDLLKSVLELLPVGVWILNEKGEIILGNAEGRNIWAGIKYVGIENFGEFKGWWLNTGQLIKPHEWSAARAIQKGETSMDEEIEIECFDGTHKILRNSTVPIYNMDGDIRGAIVTNQNITKIKQAEQSLLENERLFRESQTAAHIGSYTIDLSAGTAKASSEIYQILGIDKNELNPSEVWDLLVQLDSRVDFFGNIVFLDIKNKFHLDHEYKIIRQNDGTECWVRRLGEVEYDIEKKPIRIIGTIQDITVRKKAEEALIHLNEELESRVAERTSELLEANASLQQAKEKYRTVADHTYGWEFWTDPKGNFLYCSPSCERISGYKASEFLQDRDLFGKIIYPADQNFLNCHKQKEEKGREGNLEINYRIIHRDGSIRWMGHVCQPIYSENGELIGNRGSNRDITERKNMEQLVKTSNQKYKLLSENITDGIFICRNGCFEYVNSSMNKIFGYSDRELLGMKLTQLVLPDYLDELEIFHSLKVSADRNLNVELECFRKDLSKIFVEFLFNYIGNERVIYGVVHDITDKKLIQKNIVKAIIQTEEKERAHFSKELHDGLGPLLSTIKLYLQWSERSNTTIPREEIIQKAEDILEDALTTVREISNKLSPHLLTNHGLSSAIQSFAGKLQESSDIRINFESDLTRRLGDEIEAAIYRATIECINNTIKHARASNITIMLIDADSQLLLHYRDDGVGFNLDETLAIKKGLGLFNLQNRIQTIGGKITMYSNPGHGVDYQISVNL